jgi:hypothetical protein
MQTNAMKRALERGETQVGVWINMVRNSAILRLRDRVRRTHPRHDETCANLQAPRGYEFSGPTGARWTD